MWYRTLLTLLLGIFLSTCGRAQLISVPPALHWLADRLPETGLAFGSPGGDFGPTRTAFSEELLLWQPAGISAAWNGNGTDQLGLGSFTPYQGSDYWSHYRADFAAAPALQAAALHYHGDRSWPALRLHARRDRRERDADGDGRNDLRQRESLLAETSTHFTLDKFSGSVGGHYLRQNNNRFTVLSNPTDAATTENRRLQLNYRSQIRLYEFSPQLLAEYRSERSNRQFGSRHLDVTRNFYSIRLGSKYASDINALRGSVYADYRRTSDELTGNLINDQRTAGVFTLNGHLKYDLRPFQLTFNQQYEWRELAPDRYLPELRLAVFLLRDLQLTGLVNRGGAYRNPLLGEAHYAFTDRNLGAEPILPEDFWRTGVEISGNHDYRITGTVQFLHLNYRRYTSIIYTADRSISITQQPEASRKMFLAELNARIDVAYEHPLSISLNYRYDDLRVPGTTGMLLPAEHALWIRTKYEQRLGYGSEWELVPSVSYLWHSKVHNPTDGTMLNEQDRLDASLKLKFKGYYLAFSGEQLLRDEPGYRYGFDTLAGEERTPLGSEFRTLGGRILSLAFGIGIRR